ncbi:MAG TPA: bifunctional adenosylcobinamide kinase/adenosylcobinamide-phosphate guanylyltransferase [Solirubrobacterales bacterium]|nr:bifunctional adenosylcobinamide kinase/adenosylcobinamide-phosphate guanylyltransferase [Solirubrobacterales bacterium]
MSLTLVIGGTRSGKSARAEQLATASGLPVHYLATADSADPSMAERIRSHVERRPPEWSTAEVNGSLTEALAAAPYGACVLLDGLGPWIATAMHRAGAFEGDFGPEEERRLHERLLGDVAELADADGAELIVVAEEAGQGVLPADAPSRAWLDLLGEAVQLLSTRADRVEFMVAGRPLALNGPSAAGEGTSVAGAPAVRSHFVPHTGINYDINDLRSHGDTELRAGDTDHAVNVLAGGPPEWLREALHAALDAGAERYPDESAAVAALAALHGREPAEVVPTNGAAEALWLLPAALRPRLAACVHPAFTEGEAALRAHGIAIARVQRDPERDFAFDPAAVPDDADLVILGNPASPSGTLDPAAALLSARRPGRVLVVDEAFMDMVPGEPGSLARERLGDTIVLRSLTKSLAIPGLRAGYALAPPPLAERLRAVRPPWSANALALAALAAAAVRPDVLAEVAERAQSEREDLERRLAALPGVRTWPAAANFCLVELRDGSAALAALRAAGIAVRPAASFPGLGPNHLRITARAPAENERLVEVLGEALA